MRKVAILRIFPAFLFVAVSQISLGYALGVYDEMIKENQINE
ncbi:hypothetical protein QA584_09905 [Anaerocolumna sp. AGMB13025]|nr:hypothetical protein [Anaerocolumna sp. AGMB13025]WFR59380.1 hypothetical protein QA584_09905 [Anaerocolumna sp. AGMB13025]